MNLQSRKNLVDGSYFSVNVYTIGVKKRCRIQSRENIEIGNITFDDGLALKDNAEKLKEIEAQALAAIKATMREFWPAAEINFSKIEIEGNCLSMMLFDEANFKHKFSTI